MDEQKDLRPTRIQSHGQGQNHVGGDNQEQQVKSKHRTDNCRDDYNDDHQDNCCNCKMKSIHHDGEDMMEKAMEPLSANTTISQVTAVAMMTESTTPLEKRTVRAVDT